MPSDFDILCPTADSLASLSDHLEIATIAIREAISYAHHRGIPAYSLTVTVNRLPSGKYAPKVDITVKK